MEALAAPAGVLALACMKEERGRNTGSPVGGVERLMAGLKLPINEQKTRCLRCPEESFEFLGYRIGRNYRPNGKGAYIGTRPSKASVQGICRKMSELTRPRYGYLPVGEIVTRCPSCPLWPCRPFRVRSSARGRLPSATGLWPADA